MSIINKFYVYQKKHLETMHLSNSQVECIHNLMSFRLYMSIVSANGFSSEIETDKYMETIP